MELQVAGAPGAIELMPQRLLVAGFAGRDQAAVAAHVEELAAIGVTPPESVPTVYDLDPALLTCNPVISCGPRSSGEVEPVFVRVGGVWHLGVGSDHTDRERETVDIHDSKACCPKPIGGELVALPPDLLQGGFDSAWDECSMSSTVDGLAYPSGRLVDLLAPSVLLPLVLAQAEVDDDVDLVVFAGTLPLIGGSFRFGARMRLTLQTGAGPRLEHEYETRTDGEA